MPCSGIDRRYGVHVKFFRRSDELLNEFLYFLSQEVQEEDAEDETIAEVSCI